MTSLKRVFVIQPVIPPYRLRMFETLSESNDPQFTIITGDKGSDSLQAMSGAELSVVRHRFAPMPLYTFVAGTNFYASHSLPITETTN